MGVVSSTLHLKVKYPTHGQVGKLIRSKVVAKRCLVSTIMQQMLGKALIREKEDS